MRPKLPVFRERHAEVDLTAHILYLLEKRPSAAARFIDAIEGAFQCLAQTPEVGARRRFANPRLCDIRMWPVPGFKKYLIFYRVTVARVEVIRVLHGAQNIRHILEKET